MTIPASTAPESYPRQEAATRRFRLGVPRNFVPAPDGQRVAFVRSSGGRDPVGSLWIAEARDGALVERLVVDARSLHRADANLPPAERARRERMRETTSGITAFTADDDVSRAAFCVDGELYCAAFDGSIVSLPSPGPVVDPRMSPDGTRVAFVCDRSLYVVDADAATPARLLAEADSDTESWGLADFVAAEELDRVRGLWWLDDATLLAERVDEADVPIRWISDPAQPEREPIAHRYPAAGSVNPRARLFLLPLSADATEIDWDHAAYPYLATVETASRGAAVISVLSRDQQRQQILDVRADGTVSVAGERTATPWLTMQSGVPRRRATGELLEIVANTDDDCFQLVSDGRPLTPSTLNVTAVVDDGDHIVITGQQDPLDQGVYVLDAKGDLRLLTPEPGVHAAAAAPGGIVVASTSSDRVGAQFEARLTGVTGSIPSMAETPVVTPAPTFHRVTGRQLACAVLWPADHVPGSRRLPVVMTPYGGPHAARVRHAAGPFASDQWLANQGFAVVVVDGAGTPGRGPAFEFEIADDLATRILDDQVAALQALGGMYPDLDLERAGITGWSFGGYLAALAVLDRPDVFSAAVAGAPVTDWALYDTAYTERYLGLPQDNPGAYAAASLLPRAASLTRPLMIIHGLADDNVLAANSLQLSSALMAAGRPHCVLPLSGVTHMTPQEEVAENLLRLEVGFLVEHLAPDSTS